MNISAYNFKGLKTPETKDSIIMVNMNREEALKTIASITSQLISKSPNSSRMETYTDDGTYFSIAVLNEKDLDRVKELESKVKDLEDEIEGLYEEQAGPSL